MSNIYESRSAALEDNKHGKASGNGDIGIVRYLNKKIDDELSKPDDEQDFDYIEECLAFIDEIDKDKYKPDQDIKTKQINKLQVIYKQINNQKAGFIRHRLKWHRLAAACIMIISLLTLNIIASALGYDMLHVLNRLGREIFNLSANEEVNINGITFIRHDVFTNYSSAEELMKAENLKILYPSWLPQDTYIKKIVCIETEAGKKIIFEFNRQGIYFMLTDYAGFNLNEIERYSLYENSGNNYYICETLDGYEAIFTRGNNQYSLSYPEYDILIEIIKNLKEVS